MGTGTRSEGLLDGLDPAQRQAVVADGGPLCILAGAGSGKTRVLTRRIAWRISHGTAEAAHVLALTFTRRAASELGHRLSQLGVRQELAAGTFHAMAYRQLRQWWADNDQRPPAVLDRKARVLARLMPRRGSGASVQPADVAAEIEWAKARMVGPSGYAAAVAAADRRPPLPAEAVAELYERYEHEKGRQHRADFDDLLLLCASALDGDRRFAAAQRWRFRHLFVDEFQDVNPLQHRLLEAWRDGRDDLCVVGDPNQAIYGWNGADPGFLTRFGQRHPGATVVGLDDNYRSSPQVLSVARAVLDSGQPSASASVPARRALRPHRPDGSVPTVVSYASDTDEAAGIAAALRRRAGEVGWGQMAVLTRTHAQLVLFETALAEVGVPFRLRGGGTFLEQPEIREALGQIARMPSGTFLAAALPDLRELAEEAAQEGGAVERRGHLESLHRLAREHLATDPAASCAAFLGGLRAALGDDDPDPGTEGVVLATFHAAKGLEWDVVFLAGLEQGLLPIGHADTADARAEERRLLYVAVTRARRQLHVSWAERRTFGEKVIARSPSPYLAAVEAAVRDMAEGGSGDGWRRFVDEGRARLAAADGGRRRHPRLAGSGADPAVLDALKSWRSRTARATGVPAFVLFHDTTLAAMAEAKPRSRTALLALPGIGPVKAERYGDDLLAVVASSAPVG